MPATGPSRRWVGEVQRHLSELSREESLELLGSVSLGRIVFTLRALPAIRPVNHLLDDDAIIIRSHEGAAIVPAVAGARGAVVAYEADAIDPREHLGWSVIVTGMARLLHDTEEVARYQARLRPWVSTRMDHVIRIHPEIVTGFRLVRPPATG
ncbi:MAG: pyridoxamine 5'-phosphate oxidase family protein [Streptosporangiales bacterium]|nr:pyridoxamine 5'-phosphate oxidase family protein [Streptosporangiales bacterium]